MIYFGLIGRGGIEDTSMRMSGGAESFLQGDGVDSSDSETEKIRSMTQRTVKK